MQSKKLDGLRGDTASGRAPCLLWIVEWDDRPIFSTILKAPQFHRDSNLAHAHLSRINSAPTPAEVAC